MDINQLITSGAFARYQLPEDVPRVSFATVVTPPAADSTTALIRIDGDTDPSPVIAATPLSKGDRVVAMLVGRSRIIIATIGATRRVEFAMSSATSGSRIHAAIEHGRLLITSMYLISPGGIAAGATIATLPAGVKPPSAVMEFVGAGLDGKAYPLRAETDGRVTCQIAIPANTPIRGGAGTWRV